MKYQTINAGDHFGRLETLERIKIGRRIAWICKCSCGNTRAVLSQNLNNGTTKPLRNGYGREISSMAEPHEDYTKLGKICAAAVPKKIKRGAISTEV
jgi:hypothetical protein